MSTEESTACPMIGLTEANRPKSHKKSIASFIKHTVSPRITVSRQLTEKEPKPVEESRKAVESILLDSPSCSEHRVSFDFKPAIKEITPFNSFKEKQINLLKQKNHEKRKPKFEIIDRNLILPKGMMKVVKLKAKKFLAVIPARDTVTVKYRRKDDMEADMRALGFLPKTYIENKLIVHNLSFKETEESVAECFRQLGKVEKVILERNRKQVCTGKATVTFCSAFYPGQENTMYDLRLNGRLLRIERIKKQIRNKTRLFISHIRKNIKIAELRMILKKAGYVPKSIKIDLNDNRNRGYGFVEFHTSEQAEGFIKAFSTIKDTLGKDSFVEYSQEKQSKA